MKSIILLFSIALFSNASELRITNSFVYNGQTKYAIIDLSWKNAWYNKKNHDAAWIFMKSIFNENRGYKHLYLKQNGHSWKAIDKKNYRLEIKVAKDGTGFMLQPSKTYRGDIHVRLKIVIDENKFGPRFSLNRGEFRAYAIEMVYIPSGSFYLGEPKIDSNFASFYKSGLQGKFNGLYKVQSETKSIKIGSMNGALNYIRKNQYNGDGKGELSSDFPKGFTAFYIMKYEPKQGQYTDFLNSLSIDDSQARANFSGKNYYKERGTIEINNNTYIADKPGRPNNFMSWDDGMAYADWAALRPMTELEFTKAANGPLVPKERQFPWGNSSIDNIHRLIDKDGNFSYKWPQESDLNDSKLEEFAASYYWVMDMAGSLWERVVTVGDSIGRQFKGSHGDGQLGDFGFASNQDWPHGLNHAKGFGFRGGGFYSHTYAYHIFNPYSPTAYRPYASWSGGNRKNSYGARFVRTADSLAD